MRRLIKTNPHLRFVVIYTREPHARQLGFKHIGQPLNAKERIALARKTKKELKLDALFLVDPMGDPSRRLFGDVPNPALFIEKDGKIKDKLSWADASEVGKLLKAWPRRPIAPGPAPTGPAGKTPRVSTGPGRTGGGASL